MDVVPKGTTCHNSKAKYNSSSLVIFNNWFYKNQCFTNFYKGKLFMGNYRYN